MSDHAASLLARLQKGPRVGNIWSRYGSEAAALYLSRYRTAFSMGEGEGQVQTDREVTEAGTVEAKRHHCQRYAFATTRSLRVMNGRGWGKEDCSKAYCCGKSFSEILISLAIVKETANFHRKKKESLLLQSFDCFANFSAVQTVVSFNLRVFHYCNYIVNNNIEWLSKLMYLIKRHARA